MSKHCNGTTLRLSVFNTANNQNNVSLEANQQIM